jgi:hypothetical protein
MQNFITSFCASKPSQIMNDRLGWDEGSLHRHDCHDPPHAAGVGFRDDKSLPRRLTKVAKSAPRRTTHVQVGFPEDAIRRRRSPWVAVSGLWCTNRGEECLRKYQNGEDRHPEQEIHALAVLAAAKIELEAFAFAYEPKGYFVSHGALCAGLIELIVTQHASMAYSGMAMKFWEKRFRVRCGKARSTDLDFQVGGLSTINQERPVDFHSKSASSLVVYTSMRLWSEVDRSTNCKPMPSFVTT